MIRRYQLSVCLLVVLAGCQADPYVRAHVDSVNSEYRQLEDYVYCLEEENARLCREIETLRQARPAAGTTPGGIFRRRSTTPQPSDGSPPIDNPTIELPGSSPSSAPSSSEPPSITPLPGGTRPVRPTSGELIKAQPAPPRMPADTVVTQLFLHPTTGGADLDGHAGDDGLVVVLQPRNASGEFVPRAGAISLVALDMDREGDEARVARWDFGADAVKQLIEAATSADGIKLELPWPDEEPAVTRLKLYVRYVGPGGQRLQIDREIFVRPAGQPLNRWTPRPLERERPGIQALEQAAEEPDSSAPRTASRESSPPLPPASLSGDTETTPERLSAPHWSPHR